MPEGLNQQRRLAEIDKTKAFLVLLIAGTMTALDGMNFSYAGRRIVANWQNEEVRGKRIRSYNRVMREENSEN